MTTASLSPIPLKGQARSSIQISVIDSYGNLDRCTEKIKLLSDIINDWFSKNADSQRSVAFMELIGDSFNVVDEELRSIVECLKIHVPVDER